MSATIAGSYPRLLWTAVILCCLSGCQNTGPVRATLPATHALGPAEITAQADELTNALTQGDVLWVNRRLAPCLSDTGQDPALELRCAELYAALVVLQPAFVESLNQWLATEPNNYHARLLMGQVQAHLAWAEQGRHYPRNTPSFYRQRASAMRTLGLAHFQVAQSLRPDLPYAYAGAIEVLGDDEALEQAEIIYQRARFWVPASLVVAQAYLDANQAGGMGVYGRLDAIVADYRHQVGDDDLKADYLAAYADLLQAWTSPVNGALFQSPSQALGHLDALRDLGYDWPRLHWALADVNARLGQSAAARESMLAAVAAAPNNEFILATAACTCFGLSLDEAVALNERYVERYPSAFYGWRNLARDYLNQGDVPATLHAASEALALRPLDAEMRRYQHSALMALGENEPGLKGVDYYRALVLDGLQLDLQMVQVRDNIRRQAQLWLSEPQLNTLDRALVDHLTREALVPRLSQQLDSLSWDTDTWRAVSTFLFDQAGIADDVDDDYRQRVRLQFPLDDDNHAVAELEQLFRQTVNALVQEFIYRQSQQLPITGGGMTS